MKNIILALIIISLIGVIVYLQFSKEKTYPDRTEEVNELVQKIHTLESQDSLKRETIDSLEAVKQKTQREIVYREREIDEAIAKDSSKSLVFFRQALTENQELPDATDIPTYRELGLSAKLMSRLPKLGLKLKYTEEQLTYLKQLDKDNGLIKKGYQDIIQIKDLTIKDKDEQLAERNSFSDDRLIVYGGIGMSYGADNKLQPTIQLGLGIRILTLWKNNSITIR